MMGTVQAKESQMTCEVCGNVGDSGNGCPETYEDTAYINNAFDKVTIMGGTINPARKEVI